MHLYMVIEDQANPGILVIDSCHPNHLGHAAICVQLLTALATCYLLRLGAQDLFQHLTPGATPPQPANA
jgi:hypothetical protein